MKSSGQFVVVLISLAVLHQYAAAADKPSDLIVGKWKDRAEPDDAVIEFTKDGTGKISETTSKGSIEASVSWKVTGTFGNACIVVVQYVESELKGAKPMIWLVAFDGKDRYVTQPVENKIVFMERQK